jgi:hypothetical protein
MLCLGMHSNVQEVQDPPLCSSIIHTSRQLYFRLCHFTCLLKRQSNKGICNNVRLSFFILVSFLAYFFLLLHCECTTIHVTFFIFHHVVQKYPPSAQRARPRFEPGTDHGGSRRANNLALPKLDNTGLS